MQSFDNIEEPRSHTTPRAKRPRQRPPSPLAIYEMAEYTPPPIQTPPRPAGAKSRTRIFFRNWFAILWAAGLIVWLIMIFRYGFIYSLKSPINPIRNETAFAVFVGAFVFTVVLFVGVAAAVSPYWFISAVSLCGIGLLTTLIFATVALQSRPFDCKNMGDKFPVYVTFNSENSPAATVYMHDTAIYDLTHENIDK